jgi:putative Mg2+ transporter-C (MgtC) family protein
MISELDIIIRVLIATALGALIGFERERQNQPAGWRTHIILVIGATLAMTTSINLAIQFHPLAPNGDPARLAAQVVSGVGFLGAGAILRYGTNIKGLTTAASLWTMAVVGLVVGAGLFGVAITTTVLLLVVLELLDQAEKRIFGPDLFVSVKIVALDRAGLLKDINKMWKSHGLNPKIVSIEKNVKDKKLHIEVSFRTRKSDLFDLITKELDNFAGLESFRIT